MQRYTSGDYATDNPGWHEADAQIKADALISLLRFAGLQPRTVIDVGCGAGGVLRRLHRRLQPELPETSWEGWDIAPEAIRRARRFEGGRLRFVCGDFLRSDRRVELLLCLDVIEHVSDDLAFLSALGSRADWFVFRIPLDLSVLDLVRPDRMLRARHRYGHRHLYSREVALDLLKEAGFVTEIVRYDRVPPPGDSVRARAIDRARRSLFALAPDRTVCWLGGWSLLVAARAPGGG